MAVRADTTPVADSETSPNDAGLLPCPFCGGEAKQISKTTWVVCSEFHTDGPFAGPGEDSAAAWNTRAKVAS